MEEEGERRRRGVSTNNQRRPTQSNKSSSSSEGTSASLRCCAGGAEELKIFIWSRSCQYGGGRREVKERRGVGKTCSRERWHFNQTTILFTTLIRPQFVHNMKQIPKLCIHYRLPRLQLFFQCLELRTGVILIGAVHLVRIITVHRDDTMMHCGHSHWDSALGEQSNHLQYNDTSYLSLFLHNHNLRLKILHLKVRKCATKVASRQNGVN